MFRAAKIFVMVFLGAFILSLTQANATPLFSENFEGGLSNWTGKGGTQPNNNHNGDIVDDPLNAGNHVLTFTALNSWGDIFTANSAIAGNPSGLYILYFDYLGDPTQGGLDDDLGGFIGWVEGAPTKDRDYLNKSKWLAGTRNSSFPDILIDDGTWHSYQVAFSAPANINLMLEDFICSGGVPGDAYFDDIRLEVNPVPEPATMLLLGSGLLGLAACGRRFRKS